MNQDTLYFIKQYLLKNKKFVFPGLGEFHLTRTASYFSDGHSTLNPPVYNIRFLDSINGISAYDGNEEELVKISKEISNNLLKNKYAKIEHFGEFFITDQNGINFTGDSNFETHFNPGYLPIHDLKEVSKIFTPASDLVHVVTTKTFVDDRPANTFAKPKLNNIDWKFLKWLLPVLIILGLLACFLFIKRPAFDFDYFKPKSASKSVSALPDLNSDTTTDTNTGSESKSPVYESKLSESDSITLDRKNRSLPCAVITASLKNPKYVLKMITKLETLGYEVYTEETDSTTRIGIKYDCSRQKVDDLLNEIRTKVDAKSWVLR